MDFVQDLTLCGVAFVQLVSPAKWQAVCTENGWTSPALAFVKAINNKSRRDIARPAAALQTDCRSVGQRFPLLVACTTHTCTRDVRHGPLTC